MTLSKPELVELIAEVTARRDWLQWYAEHYANVVTTQPEDIEIYDRVLTLLSSGIVGSGWRPTHRHVKRGWEYEFLGYGRTQSAEPMTDYSMVVVYRDKDGKYWARQADEFFDGRFESLSAPPPTPLEGEAT